MMIPSSHSRQRADLESERRQRGRLPEAACRAGLPSGDRSVQLRQRVRFSRPAPLKRRNGGKA